MMRTVPIALLLAMSSANVSAQQPPTGPPLINDVFHAEVTYVDADKFLALMTKGGALANGLDFTEGREAVGIWV